MEAFNQSLLQFLQESTSPFHAVDAMVKRFRAAGFSFLQEKDQWQCKPGGKYVVTRNDSSIIAFVLGAKPLETAGFRMMGAHTDSPCLKVKPHPEIVQKSYFQLGVEVYGGVLLNPWFDRDLSLSGRVSYKDNKGELRSTLVDFKRPLAIIPSLAIHLDRDANKNKSTNPQKEMAPILMRMSEQKKKGANSKPSLRQFLKQQLEQQGVVDVIDVLDFELSFYDCQPPAMVGFESEFLASARLDNLLSCFIGMEALLSHSGNESALLVCNDHEEVGSQSASGAQGPMLKTVLERLIPNVEDRSRALDQSMMISCDNAHGIHPNYQDKHDSNHWPLLNEGPVIKINANQRYASNSETSAIFRYLASQKSVPVQSFVSRSDLGCGSTIGPLTAAEIGVKTLDVGVPQFAMHSIRELAGNRDAFYLYEILSAFIKAENLISQ